MWCKWTPGKHHMSWQIASRGCLLQTCGSDLIAKWLPWSWSWSENFNRLMGLLIRCPPPVVHKHKHSLTGNTMFLFHLHSQKRKPLTKTEACNIKLFTSMHSVTCLNRFNALWAKGNSRQLLINILQLQYLLTLNLARTDRGYRQCIHGEKIC